jgi:hypothetical protein
MLRAWESGLSTSGHIGQCSSLWSKTSAIETQLKGVFASLSSVYWTSCYVAARDSLQTFSWNLVLQRLPNYIYIFSFWFYWHRNNGHLYEEWCISWSNLEHNSINSYKVEECRLLGYKNPVCTSQETHYLSATESSQLMLCKILSIHGGDYEECRLLGCYAEWLL